ncbi:MAG: DUF4037 domain-containing protein [Treponema sp.]|nr:DUF4037 domain-containing protein [Treponema sp.]
MKLKTKILVDQFAKIISEWPGVECISINESAKSDTLDPYFALILDIYYNGTIPNSAERRKMYGGDVAAFESSAGRSHGRTGESKDRFLVKDLPVRMEYKPCKLIEQSINIADSKLGSIWLIKDSGTYGFYRLSKGEVIFSRTDWIDNLRKRMDNFSDEFWRLMRNAHQSKMEHFLSDLGAAVIHKDDFNYLISAAGFIKSACLTLFCINHRFEPSHRAYSKQVLELPVLPESFRASLKTFLRQDQEVGPERSYTIAKLIAKGIISL